MQAIHTRSWDSSVRSGYFQQGGQDKSCGGGNNLHVVKWTNGRDEEKDILDREY